MVTLDLARAQFGSTHTGQREHNEDRFLLEPTLGLFAVADGVGGHQAGEIASLISCEVLQREVAAGRSLETAIRIANHEIMAAAETGRGKPGMATTLVAARVDGPDFEVAWVGDSRAYVWNSQLQLLTRDHSYVQALLAKGAISLAEARKHPRKHIIVQALGLQGDDKLQVDSNRGQLASGELLLLCSDGLSDVLDAAAIAEVLLAATDVESCCQQLVAAALAAGGKDNVTVVLLAGAAAPPATNPAGTLAEVFWSYDPATGQYSGLPDAEREPSPAATTGGATGGDSQALSPDSAADNAIDSTRIMPLAQVEDARSSLRVTRPRRYIVWLVVAVGVTAAAIIGAQWL